MIGLVTSVILYDEIGHRHSKFWGFVAVPTLDHSAARVWFGEFIEDVTATQDHIM
jgi:hypothetical protein